MNKLLHTLARPQGALTAILVAASTLERLGGELDLAEVRTACSARRRATKG